MIRIPSSILTAGGVAVVVGAMTLALPRAAHAIAATLVLVANTASNPAVTQSVSQQAAQLVYLNTSVLPHSSTPLYQLGPGLVGTAAYTVPQGQNLVITAVDLLPGSFDGCQSGQFVFVLLGNSPIGAQVMWSVAAPNPGHFEYPSGIVFGPGSSPFVDFTFASNTTGTCGNGANVNLFGYLTSN